MKGSRLDPAFVAALLHETEENLSGFGRVATENGVSSQTHSVHSQCSGSGSPIRANEAAKRTLLTSTESLRQDLWRQLQSAIIASESRIAERCDRLQEACTNAREAATLAGEAANAAQSMTESGLGRFSEELSAFQDRQIQTAGPQDQEWRDAIQSLQADHGALELQVQSWIESAVQKHLAERCVALESLAAYHRTSLERFQEEWQEKQQTRHQNDVAMEEFETVLQKLLPLVLPEAIKIETARPLKEIKEAQAELEKTIEENYKNLQAKSCATDALQARLNTVEKRCSVALTEADDGTGNFAAGRGSIRSSPAVDVLQDPVFHARLQEECRETVKRMSLASGQMQGIEASGVARLSLNGLPAAEAVLEDPSFQARLEEHEKRCLDAVKRLSVSASDLQSAEGQSCIPAARRLSAVELLEDPEFEARLEQRCLDAAKRLSVPASDPQVEEGQSFTAVRRPSAAELLEDPEFHARLQEHEHKCLDAVQEQCAADAEATVRRVLDEKLEKEIKARESLEQRFNKKMVETGQSIEGLRQRIDIGLAEIRKHVQDKTEQLVLDAQQETEELLTQAQSENENRADHFQRELVRLATELDKRLERELEQIVLKLQEIEEKTSGLSDLDAFQKNVDKNIKDVRAECSKSVKALREHVKFHTGEQSSSTDAFREGIESLKTKVGSLQKDMPALKRGFADVEQRILEMSKGAESLEESMLELAGGVDTLRTDVTAGVDALKADLNEKVDAVRAMFSAPLVERLEADDKCVEFISKVLGSELVEQRYVVESELEGQKKRLVDMEAHLQGALAALRTELVESERKASDGHEEFRGHFATLEAELKQAATLAKDVAKATCGRMEAELKSMVASSEGVLRENQAQVEKLQVELKLRVAKSEDAAQEQRSHVERLGEEVKQASALAEGVNQTLQEHRQSLNPEEVVKQRLSSYENQLDTLRQELQQCQTSGSSSTPKHSVSQADLHEAAAKAAQEAMKAQVSEIGQNATLRSMATQAVEQAAVESVENQLDDLRREIERDVRSFKCKAKRKMQRGKMARRRSSVAQRRRQEHANEDNEQSSDSAPDYADELESIESSKQDFFERFRQDKAHAEAASSSSGPRQQLAQEHNSSLPTGASAAPKRRGSAFQARGERERKPSIENESKTNQGNAHTTEREGERSEMQLHPDLQAQMQNTADPETARRFSAFFEGLKEQKRDSSASASSSTGGFKQLKEQKNIMLNNLIAAQRKESSDVEQQSLVSGETSVRTEEGESQQRNALGTTSFQGQRRSSSFRDRGATEAAVRKNSLTSSGGSEPRRKGSFVNSLVQSHAGAPSRDVDESF